MLPISTDYLSTAFGSAKLWCLMTDEMQDVPKVFFYAAALQLAVKFIRVNTPSQSPSEPEAAQWTLDLQMWVGAFLFE